MLHVILVVFWCLCGFLGYGIALAWWDGEYPDPYFRAGNRVVAAAVAFFGPIGLLTAFLCSSFARHGLKWR